MDSKDFIDRLQERRADCQIWCSLREDTATLVTDLKALLFPKLGRAQSSNSVTYLLAALQTDLERVLVNSGQSEDQAKKKSDKFFEALPQVDVSLQADAKAMFEFDPAAESLDEVVMAYPGFMAVAVYRLAHELFLLEVPLLPRLMTEWAHRETGIDIHPGAEIGERFVIDHGTGVVIGGTCIIGNDVKIYQGVTLGSIAVRKDLAKIKRHPTIEDKVVMYAGATILGGETVVGRDSVIGGNAWLTSTVPPNSIVTRKSEVRQREKIVEDQTVDFGAYI